MTSKSEEILGLNLTYEHVYGIKLDILYTNEDIEGYKKFLNERNLSHIVAMNEYVKTDEFKLIVRREKIKKLKRISLINKRNEKIR